MASYSTHIKYYHDKKTEKVSNREHVAFLALWLCRYIFCSRSIKIVKKFIIIANQLHAGRQLCLSEMILIHLYESLGEGVSYLKNPKPKGNLIFVGPFCLLQLYLNATFEAPVPYLSHIDANSKEIKNRRVEWVQMAQLTPFEEGRDLQQIFTQFAMVFAEPHNFTTSMALLASSKVGPESFTRPFHAPKKTKSIVLWHLGIIPFTQSNTIKVTSIEEQHCLARLSTQSYCSTFCLIQIQHKPFLYKKGSFLLWNMNHIEEENNKILSRYYGRTKLDPVNYQPCFLPFEDFENWWHNYYSKEF